MYNKKVIPLLFLAFTFTTTACSNGNNDKAVTRKNCYVGDKATDIFGNSFQINNVFLNENGLYVQGDFSL